MSRPVARTLAPRDRVSPSVLLLAFALLAAVLLAALTGSRTAGAAEAPKKSTKAKTAASTKAPVDSLARLEAAVRKDSTNARAQYRLGVAYLDKDRPQEAMRAFQAATRAKPDYIEAWVNLGASHDAIGHGALARSAYRQALALRADDEIALCRMASSYYAMGLKDSAMDVLRETIAKHPRSHCSYFTLGVGFADGGMFREAIAAWEKVVAFAPGSPEAESAKESVRLLKEYLGKDSVRVATTSPPGVRPGSGGPGEAIKGGGMHPAPAAKDAHGHAAGDGHKH
jgi:tetratricopeptide (TPR) repeat protein